ncbi:hypothetical protein F5880DRAFT_1505036 [Lentinula raphanica]|nr:hypothetical protein F5880DRAFT_1505036 [Lentinula raphanica]
MQIPLLLRSTPSIQNPQRKHVTHGTPEICDLLKTMDLQSRLEANKEIDTENRRRRKQELAHLRDPSKPMPSPRASLITITSEEYEEIRTTPSRLQAFASLLLDPVRKFFAEKDVYEKSLKRLREEPKEDEEERLRKRRVADRLIYKEYDPLAPIRVEIHQVLYEIAHISPIPLPFFANQNLEFIAANSHSLPRKKIKSDKNPQGGHLLDLEALAKTLEIDLCESDKMEGLDFILFTECANNMIAFETERDPDGATGTRAQLFIKHFAFFLNKREAPKWFNHWKPTEFKLRKNQYLVPTGFVSSVYTAEWSKVELKAELAESFPTFDSSIQFPSGPACPPTPSFVSPSMRPLSEGSRGRDLAPHCIGCGKRGHILPEHINSEHGLLPWAQVINRALCTPDSAAEKICIPWNISGSSCNCKLAHICSLCGSHDHPALAGKCGRLSP